MKWIGQHIWDLASRFRDDVYFEDLQGSSETTALVIDGDGKVTTNSLIAGGNGESKLVRLEVRYGEAVSKGDPVYVSGYHGSVGPVIMSKANASNDGHMPAFGLADADYSINATGYAISIGNLQDLNTSSYSVGDTLYVATGGGLTNVKPTGTNYIQNVATVSRSNANNGQIEVVATGRSNDVPTPLYIDHSNQQLGIGTASPSQALDVFGNIKMQNNNALMSENVAGGTRSLIALGNDNILRIKGNDSEGSSNVISMVNGGNVGIGTTSPGQKLEVNGSAVVKGNMMLGSSASGEYIARTGSPYRLGLFTNSAERISVINGGNVGIGTTTPASLLHVAGTVQVGEDDAGHDVKFYGATAGKYLLWDESQNRLEFTDATYAAFGTDGDMLVYHTGADGFITEKTGHLYIRTQADDKDVILQSDDGSGGVTAYLTLDGGLGHTTIDKRLRANDNVDFAIGTGNDLRLIHDGTHSYMTNYTGDFYIANHADDKDIIFQSDDGSGGLTPYLTLDGSAGTVEIAKDTNVSGNVSIAGTLTAINKKSLNFIFVANRFVNSTANETYFSLADADRDVPKGSEDGIGVVAVMPCDGILRQIEMVSSSNLSGISWTYRLYRVPSGTAYTSEILVATVTASAGGAGNTNTTISLVTDPEDGTNDITYETGYNATTMFTKGDRALFSLQSNSDAAGSPKINTTFCFELDESTI